MKAQVVMEGPWKPGPYLTPTEEHNANPTRKFISIQASIAPSAKAIR